MHSDLILMLFDDQVDAQRVYDAIQSMRHSQLLGLDHAIIVSRDNHGEINLFQKRHPSNASWETDPLSTIADQIFSSDTEKRQTELSRMGVDDRFAKRIVESLEVSNSALLALLRYEDIADRDELVRTLALFRGQILQTTVSA